MFWLLLHRFVDVRQQALEAIEDYRAANVSLRGMQPVMCAISQLINYDFNITMDDRLQRLNAVDIVQNDPAIVWSALAFFLRVCDQDLFDQQ